MNPHITDYLFLPFLAFSLAKNSEPYVQPYGLYTWRELQPYGTSLGCITSLLILSKTFWFQVSGFSNS